MSLPKIYKKTSIFQNLGILELQIRDYGSILNNQALAKFLWNRSKSTKELN